MNSILKRKLELTFIGYLFTMLNLAMTVNNYPIMGIFFGGVSVIFFIKALMLKNEKDN